MHNHTPTQPDLPLDFTMALETEMREYFNARWLRWHRAGSFEVAMQDAVTRRCLVLAVQHLPHNRRGTEK